MHHTCWACALEPGSHDYWAQVPTARAPQQEKPLQGEACAPQLEKHHTHSNKDPAQPEINNLNK